MSFGGSGGSSGSAGTIRYSIIIDDSQINSKLSNIQQRLSSLDSASQSVGAGLTSLNIGIQSIGTNAQNAGTGLTNLSSDIQNLSTNTKSAKTDLDAINSNWQTMEQGARNSANSVDALGNVFKSTEGGLNQYNTLSGEVIQNTNSMADATLTSGQKMKQFGSFLKDNALSVGIFSVSIVDLISSYTQLQKTQLTAQRMSLMAERAQQRVEIATARVNKLVVEGKKGTTEYNLAVKNLALAQQDAGIKTERAALATQTANEAAARFIPQFIQDSVLLGSSIAQMASSVKDIGPQLKGFGGILRGLGPAMIAFTGPILVAVAGIYSLLGALRAAQKLNELVQQKTGGKALTMSPLEAFRKQLFGSPEEKKQAAEFDKQLKGNIVTAKEYEDILKESFDPMSMLDDITGKVTKKLGDMQNVASGTAETTNNLSDNSVTLTKNIDAENTTVEDQLNFAKFLDDKRQKLIATTKEYSKQTVDLVNHIATEAQRFNLLTKESDKFNQVMKTATGAATTAEISKQVDSVLKLKKGYADMLTVLNGGDKAMQELMKSWHEFQQSSRLDLADKLGLKSISDKVDNLVKKITKDLPNKIDGIKLKTKLNMEIDNKSIGQAAAKIIMGLSSEIQSSDKAADAVAKSIRDNLPHNDAGDAMKTFLDDAINKSNTADILFANIKQIEDGSYTLTIPVKGKWMGFGNTRETAGIDFDTPKKPPTKNGKYIPAYFDTQNEQALLGHAPKTREELYALLDAYGIHGGGASSKSGLPGQQYKNTPISDIMKANPNDILARQIDQITKNLNVFAKVIVQVTKDVSVYAKSIMTTVADHNVFAKTTVTIIKDINVYAKTLVTLTKDISVYAKAVVTTIKDHNTFAKTIVTITKDNNTYAKTIVTVTKDLSQLARATVTTTKDNNQLARSIVQVTKDLKQEESQARKTASAIRSIPSGGFSGGGFNFAKGGIISAANGIMTTQGPTILVGDNPGGRETVAAIPHNNPYPTVKRIDRMFGSGSGSDGSTVNQTIHLHISGNDIINERNLEKRIKLTVGENRDRFG